MKNQADGNSLSEDRIRVRSLVSAFLACVCAFFALRIVFLPFQWLDDREGMLRQIAEPLVPESLPSDVSHQKTDSGTDEILPFGKEPSLAETPEFLWDDPEALALNALASFQTQNRNVPALYAASLLSEERYSAAKKLELVNAVYVELFGRAYGQERTASGGEYPSGFASKLIFLENLEKNLTDALVPKEIADCMILKFTRTQKDFAVKKAMTSLFAYPEMSNRLKRENDLAERLRRVDVSWFMNAVKASCAETVPLLSGRQSAWLRKLCDSPDERNAWSSFRKDPDSLKSVRDFAALPAVYRTMTAVRFFRLYGSPESAFLQKMSEGNYQSMNFLREFEQAARNPSADFLRFLRSNPEWIEQLNSQNYAEARKVLLQDWARLFPEDPVPNDLLVRIQHGLEKERLFAEASIRGEIFQQSMKGKKFMPERFGALVRAASVKVPESGTKEYTEWSKGLACMFLNRGMSLGKIRQYADVTSAEIIRYMNMENMSDAGNK